MEPMEPNFAAWLTIAKALVRDWLPADAGIEAFGHGMEAGALAALIDRERERVDHTLQAMAEAADEVALRAIRAQLSADTLMALLSRLAHTIERLHALQALQGSVPPVARGTDPVWRSLLQAMASGGLLAAAPGTVQ